MIELLTVLRVQSKLEISFWQRGAISDENSHKELCEELQSLVDAVAAEKSWKSGGVADPKQVVYMERLDMLQIFRLASTSMATPNQHHHGSGIKINWYLWP